MFVKPNHAPWWNPATEKQAIDRAHRIGQTKNVMVYRYVAEGTIEENTAEDIRGLFEGSDCDASHLSKTCNPPQQCQTLVTNIYFKYTKVNIKLYFSHICPPCPREETSPCPTPSNSAGLLRTQPG